MSSVIDKIRNYRPWQSTQEIPRTIAAFFWFLLCAGVAGATNAWLDRANPFVGDDNARRVHDPLLEALAPVYDHWGIPDDLPDILVKISPIFMILRLAIAGRQSCLIFRRCLYLVGFAFLIRSIIVSITMLPNPNYHCKPHPQPNFFIHSLELILQIKASCGDVVFSGHTIIFMAACLIWYFNPHPTLNVNLYRSLTGLAIVFNGFGILSLVAATYHYTLDCLLSFITMIALWKLYYYTVSTQLPTSSLFAKGIIYIDGDVTKEPTTPTTPTCFMG